MNQPTLDLQPVERMVHQLGGQPDRVVPLLHAIQRHYHYLPAEALQRVCELTEITPATITGVSTFYDAFRHRPRGKHLISICHGTACHVKGSWMIQDAIEQALHLEPGADTDSDNQFTVEKAACFGCCTLAPVVRIDGHNYGNLASQDVPHALEEFLETAAREEQRLTRATRRGGSRGTRQKQKSDVAGEIRIGLDSCCIAQGCGKVHEALADVLALSGAPARLKRVGCQTMCHQTPLVEVITPLGEPVLYAHVQPEQVRELVFQHFRPQGLLRRVKHLVTRWLDHWYPVQETRTLQSGRIDRRQGAVCRFLGPQKHIAMEHYGELDGLDIEEYERHGGFQALRACLTTMEPEAVVGVVRDSGLRGRGGAGFPTHVKWDLVRRQADAQKYVICNGDEGDPGAFMDRMLLESFPYRVIEGLAIAACAVGAHEGFFYVRAEYPDAVAQISEAIARCEQRGILGPSVLGSGYALTLAVKEGAGAFVCGEETALIHSIEGQRGTPRLRPPYPAESGLWERPTLINNVETLAVLPWILRHGPQAFAALGTENSRGTKVFALAGKVQRGGLIEVPMGVTLRQIVEEIGGGVAPGRRFKAIQIGGPSGGCLPADLADTPVDYQALAAAGAIMGSGGLVVLDDADCMVDIARYFLRFTQEQSCGKCTYCRIGTKRMLDIMDRICSGQARRGDLDQLEQLAGMVGAGSLCGLGKTAPNPVLSTLKYFRDEYQAHLDGRCPAGKCQQLIHYEVTSDCIGCTLCAQHCPADAIPFTPYQKHVVDDAACTRCDACRQACPERAIVVTSGGQKAAVSCLT